MKLPMPAAALGQHVIVLGKTRAGKSSKLRVLVEHLLEHDKPVCIIDPKGDWWGLKSSADGKSAGYPVVIFGGEHADVPINRHSGQHVAELIATGNRPAIIDLGGWMVSERTEFFIAFASHLFKLTKGARHLVIDEVHNFCPKGKIMDPNAGRMLHWANRLASEGAGKGITLMAASQRPQKVHNDFLTSCETLIACKVIHKADRQAFKDWIDGCADPDIGKDVLAGLAQLKKPEAWVWSPEAEFGPKLVEFPMYSTYDSFAVQKTHAAKLKGWASVDLDEVRAKLEAVVKEAEANDPTELKRKLAQARRDLAVAQKATPAPPTSKAGASREQLQAAEQRGFARGQAAAHKDLVREVRTIRIGLIGAVQAAAGSMNAQLRARVEELVVDPPAPTAPAAIPIRDGNYAEPMQAADPKAVKHVRSVRQAAHDTLSNRGNGTLPIGERAILGACIQYQDGLDRTQLTVLTGYKKSSRDTYIARLREKGYVETRGNRVAATNEGTAALPDYEPLPTGEELRELWRQRLPDGERKILEVLCAAYPDSVTRDAISQETGYLKSSRDTYLARMRARQVITEPERGLVRASETLFQ